MRYISKPYAIQTGAPILRSSNLLTLYHFCEQISRPPMKTSAEISKQQSFRRYFRTRLTCSITAEVYGLSLLIEIRAFNRKNQVTSATGEQVSLLAYDFDLLYCNWFVDLAARLTQPHAVPQNSKRVCGSDLFISVSICEKLFVCGFLL